MAALTWDRNTPDRSGREVSFPAKANTRIFSGALVGLAAGLAEPGKITIPARPYLGASEGDRRMIGEVLTDRRPMAVRR